uniref:SUZ domain-containing protein n=1 Tax=Malurus cyaneus samueli TaxID=2593467 RepID=A0A8C5U0T3_9PASS
LHLFKDDRRSKSIEEREEEYQRVRERIFAQDVSSYFNCLFSAIPSPVVRQSCPPPTTTLQPDFPVELEVTGKADQHRGILMFYLTSQWEFSHLEKYGNKSI